MTYLLRSLARRPGRTLTTVIGVALAAAFYAVLATLSGTLSGEILGSAGLLGSDLTVQAARAPMPTMSWIAGGQLELLGRFPGVRRVLGAVIGSSRLDGSGQLFVFGFGPGAPDMRGVTLVQGRFYQSGDADEIVLGTGAAKWLGLAPGDRLEIRAREFTVVGVYRTGRGLLDMGAALPLKRAQALYHTGNRVNLAFLELDDPAQREAVEHAIELRLPELDAGPVDAWVGSIQFLGAVESTATVLGLVAFLVLTLGVSNIMVMNVAERMSELAVLRVVGWSRARIGASVVAEAAVIGVVGGVLSLGLSWVLLVLLPLESTGGLVDASLGGAIALHTVLLSVLAASLGSVPALMRALAIEPARVLRAG